MREHIVEIDDEIGVVRRCTTCHEWWPLDDTFFYRQVNGFMGYQGRCKACVSERAAYVSRREPQMVPA